MDTTWKTMTLREREEHFNPRVAVPSADAYLQRAATAAAAAREQLSRTSRFDIDYGDGPNQNLDVLRGSSSDQPAPVVVFIHGGYWRALDKNDHTHLALPFTPCRRGIREPELRLMSERNGERDCGRNSTRSGMVSSACYRPWRKSGPHLPVRSFRRRASRGLVDGGIRFVNRCAIRSDPGGLRDFRHL